MSRLKGAASRLSKVSATMMVNDRFHFLIPCFGLLMLNACSNSFLNSKRFVPEKVDHFARSYITAFEQKDFTKLEEPLAPRLKSPTLRSALEEMAHMMDQGQPQSTEMAGWNVNHFNNQTRYDLTYQIKFEKTWRLANLVMIENGGTLVVDGVHVYPMEKSLQEANTFTLNNKPAKSRVFLAVVILVPLFMLASFISCLCSRLPMKWLIAFACLIGIGSFSMNWTDGRMNFNLLSIQLLGVGAGQLNPYSPWILVASLPFGALGFWLVKLLQHKPVDESSENIPPPLPA